MKVPDDDDGGLPSGDATPPRDVSLAAERTTLAWRRTGMSTVVVGGLAAKGLSGDAPLFGYGCGLMLGLVGMAVMVVGRHRDTDQAAHSVDLVPLLGRTVALVAWSVVVVTLLSPVW